MSIMRRSWSLSQVLGEWPGRGNLCAILRSPGVQRKISIQQSLTEISLRWPHIGRSNYPNSVLREITNPAELTEAQRKGRGAITSSDLGLDRTQPRSHAVRGLTYQRYYYSCSELLLECI
ncbi:hypothetical protein FVEG_15607 [Fusarium verticillioides 7600]|uniref:Uncharacterized protein n=1 Tax=Gibberella moniliformis (strain M3125 / FGSC 7600) TaxID=334819 RepID=W7MGR7_GIBM7|nr:hypothetical protein FVEG_15607 [Fusarium verticillioides 7600]XP_018750169.1 hypothetical protein FVEG_15607 [Fusarium verticillioides 7600]EWG43977.1 hypothetical protein FVEG_15607 [Fusarium verticillioides 7600]EWG43978.1 hypothetical protein FVEG_15607 [Fusarium verticillioides 7600]